KTQGDGRAGVCSDQAQPADQPVPAARQIRGTLGVAADRRDSQPDEAPQAPPGRPGGLKRELGRTNAPSGTQAPTLEAPLSSPLAPSHRPRQTLSDTHRPIQASRPGGLEVLLLAESITLAESVPFPPEEK